MEYQGKRYEMIFGSDVINDGVYLELWDEYPDQLLLFALRSDVDGSITFSSYRENIPFGLVEQFIKAVHERLL